MTKIESYKNFNKRVKEKKEIKSRMTKLKKHYIYRLKTKG